MSGDALGYVSCLHVDDVVSGYVFLYSMLVRLCVSVNLVDYTK